MKNGQNLFVSPGRILWDMKTVVSLALVLLLGGVLRFAALGADPALWVPFFITDEGWWADSARGKVLFNNYFADDSGTGYLAAPVYTWLLQSVYSVAGVGLVQTRFLAALCSMLTIALVALLTLKWAGLRPALVASSLLALSPFFVSYNRIGMLESTMCFFLIAAFALSLTSLRRAWVALPAGFLIVMAIAVKPTAIFIGLLPLLVANLTLDLRQGLLAGLKRSQLYRSLDWKRYFYLFAGLLLGGGLIFLVIVVPNWDIYWRMLMSEGGVGKGNLMDHFTGPGYALMSLKGGTAVIWFVALFSPLLVTALWLYFLSVLARPQAAPQVHTPAQSLELFTMAWVVTSLLVMSIRATNWYNDRYYIPLLPPIAILCGLASARFFRRAPAGASALAAPARRSWFSSLLLWGMLLIPLVILLKPLGIEALRHALDNIHIGNHAGVGTGGAAMLFMFLWGLLVLSLSFFPRHGRRFASWLVLRAARPLLGLMFLVECAILGNYFATTKHTIERNQADLTRYIKSGEIVLGQAAATICMPFNVRTVRRALPSEFSSPPPNPDVWDRLRPRYILEFRHWNFNPIPYLYSDLTVKGYKPVHRFIVGPQRKGVPCFELELYEQARPMGQAVTSLRN